MQKIFIGLLLLFFDFKINNFDILPQFVGYFLIGQGFSELSKTDAAFDNRSELFYGFSVLSLCLIGADLFIYLESIRYVLEIVAIIIHLSALYLIYLAVYNSEQKSGELNAKHLKDCWTFLLIMQISSLISVTFLWEFAMLLSIIFGFIAYIAFLIAFHHTQDLYEERAKNFKENETITSIENPTDNF